MVDLQGLYAQVIRKSPQDLTTQARLALMDRDVFNMDKAEWREYLVLFSEDIRPHIIEQDRLKQGMW